MQEEIEEEQDDEIIGTAFRWSLLVFAMLGLVGLAVFFWPKPKTEEIVIEKKTGDISTLTEQESTEESPKFDWQNIAPDCGIDFVHFSGATGERLLPETMGGGVAVFDYNNDGHADVLFISGTTWAESDKSASQADEPPLRSSIRLYQNDGKAQFNEVTEDAGLDCQLMGMGCAIGDYNNDGWIDLYVTCVGNNALFQNVEGHFTDVTAQAVVAGGSEDWSTAAGFFDYDHDGLLDLMVCNYVRWNRELDYEVNFTLNGVDRAYGPPTHYRGTHPYLFKNLGDGSFQDVSAHVGLQQMNKEQNIPLAKSLGMLLLDVDGDSWDDIVVANDTVRNQFFVNQKDGTFAESAVVSGLAYDRMGNATGAMGIDMAHLWNDDSKVIAIGNFANEMSSVYVSQGSDSSFVDQAAILGIGAPTRQRLSFGTLWDDFDLDGRFDFLQINGHLEDTISEIQPSQTYKQSAQLFWNNGKPSGVCFTVLVPEKAGDLAMPIVGRGVVSGDLSGDGKPDLVITQIDGPPLVLLNRSVESVAYLRVKLDSGDANRYGIGAMIQLQIDEDIKLTRYMTSCRSYLSQGEPIVTFGVPSSAQDGESTTTATQTIPLVKVRWPDGSLQTLEDVPVNQTVIVRKSEVSGKL